MLTSSTRCSHVSLATEMFDRSARSDPMSASKPIVVIVGAGFGGLAAAHAFTLAGVSVIVIDRSNHHVFQPLLYQVATSVLAPGQIATPIRGLLADQENTSVMLGTVTGIDAATRHVIVDAGGKEALR